jgi:phosphatidylserine/phosphatidylglycerophosphate/cardiolipin synthase-like enzyme
LGVQSGLGNESPGIGTIIVVHKGSVMTRRTEKPKSEKAGTSRTTRSTTKKEPTPKKPTTTARAATAATKAKNGGGIGCLQILFGLVVVVVLVAALYFRLIEIDFETGEITFPEGDTPSQPVPSTASGGDWYEIYFTRPGPDSDYPEPEIIAAMDAAEERIWVAVFDWDLEGLTAAMIRAHRRGVDVRLIVDTDNMGLPEIRELQQARVSVQDDVERSAFMHNKFMVVDSGEVWFGSLNLTDNDLRRNNNNFMRIFSFELNANFATEFGEMWEQQFGPRSPANTPYPLLSFDASELDLYFSPEDKPRDEILRVLNDAESEIRFMAFSFTDEAIGTALINADNQGLEVSGVIETFQSDGTGSQYQRLRSNRLDVKRDGNGGVMHHKVMIIDQEIVILGSYNFTASAYQSNDETLVIIKDAGVAAAFLEEYERVWTIAK